MKDAYDLSVNLMFLRTAHAKYGRIRFVYIQLSQSHLRW